MSFRRVALAAILSLVSAAPALAEVEKFMKRCDGQLCPFFRASTSVPEGWEENAEATDALKVQLLLPKGQSFEKTPAKIYVLVSYDKAKAPAAAYEPDVLSEWKGRAAHDRKAKIEKLGELARGEGKPPYLTYRLTSPKLKEQGFERAAVTTDTDKDGNEFFVIVVLSANSRAALDEAGAAYDQILKSY